ncbi:MAG: hypothetical protein GY775_18870 [Candidatus Scalindua sp.]|nr:hypothetical protein [Candidatus Scalindua sp.]
MVELPFPSSRRGDASTGWRGRVVGGIRLTCAIPGSPNRRRGEASTSQRAMGLEDSEERF